MSPRASELARAGFVVLALAAFSSTGPAPAGAQSGWRVEVGTFLPWSVPLPLRVRQAGEPDLRFNARFASEPWTRPFVWIGRLGYWVGDSGWELEALHHKLVLRNGPDEIQRFSISHGFNVLTLNRAWARDSFVLRVGGGVVLAHPENTVRGHALSEDEGLWGAGYYVRGPVGSAALARVLPLPGPAFLTTEAKLTATRLSVPVADGRATLTSVIAQVSVLVGWRTR